MSTRTIEAVHGISQVIANARDAAGAAEQAANLLQEYFAPEGLKLQLWHEDDHRLARIEQGRLDASAGYRFSRRIELRGEEFGRLELVRAEGDAELDAALETVARLLGTLAELDGLKTRIERLEQEKRDFDWKLKNEKVIARATGIVARMRGTSMSAAAQWLKDESARHGVPAWQLSERVVEGEKLTHRLKSPPPLRKTA